VVGPIYGAIKSANSPVNCEPGQERSHYGSPKEDSRVASQSATPWNSKAQGRGLIRFFGFQSWVPGGGSSGGEFVQGGLMGAGLRDKPLNVQNQS